MNKSNDKLELEVSGIVYTNRSVIEISKDSFSHDQPNKDSGVVSSVEIVNALKEIRAEVANEFGKVSNIDKIKSDFISFIEDLPNKKEDTPRIVIGLCKTWDYLIYSSSGEYSKFAGLSNYNPSEERENKVWSLLEKYNVDLSLGAEDLYIGVKRETGLWFEEHI